MEKLTSKVNIVVPVLNDEACLRELLGQVAGFEVIVVDGGSQDASAAVAQEAGARVLTESGGRGAQLAKGAGQTRLEWLLFLHADSRLGAGWQEAIGSFIARNSHPLAVFRFKLDDQSFQARLLERLVYYRCRFFGLPYGDQGLLIHRSHYLKVGGFPKQPLMEDVALISQFHRKQIYFLDVPLTTRAERFRQRGYIRQSLRNLFLLCLYFLGVSPERLVKLYR